MKILVLDVGTSSMRGTLMAPDGAVLQQESIQYSPVYRENGWVEQPAEDWTSAAAELCRRTAERGTVDAVAFTAQRSSVVPVDGAGRPLCSAIMWQDTRSQEICEALSRSDARIAKLSGAGINTVFAASKMTWLRRNAPELYENTAFFFTVADCLAFQMTGKRALDHTYGSRSLLMELASRQWSPELLRLFQVEEKMLSPLVPPSSAVGTVSPVFAAAAGLRQGIPVITCGGDQQCGALGQGVIAPGTAAVNLGTGAYLVAATDRVPEDSALICSVSGIGEQYLLESSVLTCGSALNWFLREFCPGADVSLVAQALEQTRPGAGGVLCLPYFQGRSNPYWNSEARASFHGVSLAATRLDFLRALLEGICGEVACQLDFIGRSQKTDVLHVSGGLSRTEGVRQLLADISGKPVVCSGQGDATTRGAWMSAARCLGLCASWEQAWEIVRPKDCRTYQPRPELSGLYRLKRRQMEQLSDKQAAK